MHLLHSVSQTSKEDYSEQLDIDNEHNSNINAQFKKNCHLEVEKNFFFFWVIKNITKFRDGAGAGVVSSESGTVGGAGGLGTVGAGAGA